MFTAFGELFCVIRIFNFLHTSVLGNSECSAFDVLFYVILNVRLLIKLLNIHFPGGKVHLHPRLGNTEGAVDLGLDGKAGNSGDSNLQNLL
jgi:hypothetical protein